MPMISIVIPTHNEVVNVEMIVNKITNLSSWNEYSLEIIFVDDSTDTTPEKIRQLISKDDRIKLLELTRSFGQAAAIQAGLDYCTGSAAIVMDVDGQDPPELIPAMLDWWKSGIEVVITERSSQGTWLYRRFSSAFYWFLNKFGEVEIPKNAGEFRLIDRVVIDFLRDTTESHRFFRGQSVWPGYRSKTMLFDRNQRHKGQSNYSFLKSLRVGLDGIFGFTLAPLRIAYLISLLFFAATFLIIAMWIVGKLLRPHLFSSGWMSIVTLIFAIGSVQMFFLGILGEYIAKIFQEVLKRPIYVVARTHNLERPHGR